MLLTDDRCSPPWYAMMSPWCQRTDYLLPTLATHNHVLLVTQHKSRAIHLACIRMHATNGPIPPSCHSFEALSRGLYSRRLSMVYLTPLRAVLSNFVHPTLPEYFKRYAKERWLLLRDDCAGETIPCKGNGEIYRRLILRNVQPQISQYGRCRSCHTTHSDNRINA